MLTTFSSWSVTFGFVELKNSTPGGSGPIWIREYLFQETIEILPFLFQRFSVHFRFDSVLLHDDFILDNVA